jgi:hypothetical protein
MEVTKNMIYSDSVILLEGYTTMVGKMITKNITNMNNKEQFGLDQRIDGVDAIEYMAKLIEKNETQSIEIERGKLAVGILKQMNNRSRLLLDAAKFDLKCKELERSETN